MKNSSNSKQVTPAMRRTAFIIALLVEYLVLLRILFASTLSISVADALFSLVMLAFVITLTWFLMPSMVLNKPLSNKRGMNALLKAVLTVSIFVASFISCTLLLSGTLWVIFSLAQR